MFDFLPAVPAAALRGGPLTQVITQVTFNPQSLLATAAGAVAVHEQVNERYPRYVAEQQAMITAGPAGVSAQQAPQWRFVDLAGEQSVVLSGDSVALETTAYQSWSDNLDRLDSVLRAVSTVSAPRVRERLGLRYVNQVSPDDAGAFSGRVSASLLGMAASTPWQGPLNAYLAQVSATDGPVHLGLRYGCGPQVAGPNFVIDIDCSVTEAGTLDVEEMLALFTELNDLAWRCFCACIEPSYREMLTA